MKFSSKQTKLLAGCSDSQLHDLIRVKRKRQPLVQPSYPSSGPGVDTLYDFRDLVKIKAALNLQQLNIGREWSEILINEFESKLKGKKFDPLNFNFVPPKPINGEQIKIFLMSSITPINDVICCQLIGRNLGDLSILRDKEGNPAGGNFNHAFFLKRKGRVFEKYVPDILTSAKIMEANPLTSFQVDLIQLHNFIKSKMKVEGLL